MVSLVIYSSGVTRARKPWGGEIGHGPPCPTWKYNCNYRGVGWCDDVTTWCFTSAVAQSSCKLLSAANIILQQKKKNQKSCWPLREIQNCCEASPCWGGGAKRYCGSKEASSPPQYPAGTSSHGHLVAKSCAAEGFFNGKAIGHSTSCLCSEWAPVREGHCTWCPPKHQWKVAAWAGTGAGVLTAPQQLRQLGAFKNTWGSHWKGWGSPQPPPQVSWSKEKPHFVIKIALPILTESKSETWKSYFECKTELFFASGRPTEGLCASPTLP